MSDIANSVIRLWEDSRIFRPAHGSARRADRHRGAPVFVRRKVTMRVTPFPDGSGESVHAVERIDDLPLVRVEVDQHLSTANRGSSSERILTLSPLSHKLMQFHSRMKGCFFEVFVNRFNQFRTFRPKVNFNREGSSIELEDVRE